MNIFILDQDINLSAQYHVDKHCVKMILEHAQMLSTVINTNPELCNIASNKINDIIIAPYKSSHQNHPCTLWLTQNYDNFAWLVAYTDALHTEYNYRYNKEHLSYLTLQKAKIITQDVINYGKNLNILQLNPACVVPDDCKLDNIIASYRTYYKKYKSHIFKWTKRDTPKWIL